MIEQEPDPLRRIPTKHPAEVHVEVGAILRAARLKRGQSLEAVAQQTRIPKRYLESLENDRLDEFPAFVYMRGFLKGYCEHLDVSFDELWAKIQPPQPEEPHAPGAAAPAAKPGAAASSGSGGKAPPTLVPRTTEPKVGLRAIDDAWVRVTVDDDVAFEGRLPRGGAMEWRPTRFVSLRTTAPASLQLTVTGAPQALVNPTPDGEYRIEVQ